MAKLVFGLNQSLDGYVDHAEIPPDPILFRHFTEQVQGVSGIVYGRRMYEVMRYWGQDDPARDEEQQSFAAAWQSRPKWIASHSLKSVGPNTTLIEGDIQTAVRALKDQLAGEVDVAGPDLAQSLAELIDEYRLYIHPIALGHGKPFFSGPRSALKLVAHDPIGEAIRLTYVPR
jgi:dihydrofolate reductase